MTDPGGELPDCGELLGPKDLVLALLEFLNDVLDSRRQSVHLFVEAAEIPLARVRTISGRSGRVCRRHRGFAPGAAGWTGSVRVRPQTQHQPGHSAQPADPAIPHERRRRTRSWFCGCGLELFAIEATELDTRPQDARS